MMTDTDVQLFFMPSHLKQKKSERSAASKPRFSHSFFARQDKPQSAPEDT